MIPNISKLADRPRLCLQEAAEEIPNDVTRLFNQRLFSISTNMVPEAVLAYSQLNVKHEPLCLITPQFETPLPPLQPAVFPPSFRDLPPAPLELYDLDEAFSSERLQIAQLTNKYDGSNQEQDLEYFIKEASRILGLNNDL